MSHTNERAGFTVTIDGGFVAHQRWLVYGSLTYHAPGPSQPIPPAVVAEARFQLLLEVVQESRRGWSLGAREVDVLVDGDADVSRVFRPACNGPA